MGTRLTFTAECHTVCGQKQAGGYIRSGGVRRHHAADRRLVARRVGQDDIKGLTVVLRGAQANVEVTVSTHSARTDHIARRIFNRHRRARLALAADGLAIRADRQAGRSLWSGGVRRHHATDRGLVTRRVGQGYVEFFAVGLGRVQGHLEVAISPDRAGADHVTGRILDCHFGTGLALADNAQAIAAHRNTGWSTGRCGIAITAMMAATTTATAQRSRRATHRQKAKPPQDPIRNVGTAASRGQCEVVKAGNLGEGKAGVR